MGWLISIIFIIIGILAVALPLAVIGGIIYYFVKLSKKGQQHSASINTVAAELNLKNIGNVPVMQLAGAQYFRLFNLGNRDSRQVRNLMTGVIEDFSVSIFDYWYSVGGDGGGINVGGGVSIGSSRAHGGRIQAQTVVMLESNRLNLPLFSMRPESGGILQKMGDMFGGQDIDFPSNPVFSDKYLLYGANEQQIRQIFNPQILAYFESSAISNAEGGGNRLFVYQSGSFNAPQDYRWLLAETMKAARLF